MQASALCRRPVCRPPRRASPPPTPPQLANTLSTEALFYTCIIPFIIFFGAFAFVIYPMRDIIHPTGELLVPRGGRPGTLSGRLASCPCMHA